MTATLVNGMAGAILIVGAVQPLFGAPGYLLDWLRISLAMFAAFLLHLAALHTVRGIED